MNNTLCNWTLHGQNLGDMLRNNKKQYRNLRTDHRREFGHFFNMMSDVLDTIGSMTKNTILRSVNFENNESRYHRVPLLGSGGNENAPQPKLPPMDTNLSRYIAFSQTINLTMATCWNLILLLDQPYFLPIIPLNQMQTNYALTSLYLQ